METRAAHILIALTLALLAGCASGPAVPPADTAARETAAASALERGDFVRARELYEELAAASQGEDRARYRIERARAEIGLGDPASALATLDGISAALSPGPRSELLAVRAEALFALGRTADAVTLLVEREIWLESAAAILDNQNRIWNGLALPQSQAAANQRTGDDTIDGWLALAPLTRQGDDGAAFRATLLDWLERFSGHPAAAGILAERLQNARGPAARPDRFALLLPLTSSFRGEAHAIRDGVYAAMFESGNARQLGIRIYDTAQGSVLDSYFEAQLDGADVILGPLLPADVDAVQAQAGFVPTLALNIGDEPAPRAANFFRFALSSDDEIEAIATRAIAAGHETAVILTASDERGSRLMNNFRNAFESRGGRVLNTGVYVRGTARSAAPIIEALLNITRSTQRHVQLENTLGRFMESVPRRRADIDMIFLEANPADARLLVPLLEDDGAGDIPTYATRQVYDPTRLAADTDLDGLIFPDIPLLHRPVGEAGTAARMLAETGASGSGQYPREFALGFDAYLLAEALYDGAGPPYGGAAGPLRLDGATGELWLDDTGRIRRILPFARFSGGRPEAAEQAPAAFDP